MVFDPAAIDRLRRAFGDDGPVVTELVATFRAESPPRPEARRQGVTTGHRAGGGWAEYGRARMALEGAVA